MTIHECLKKKGLVLEVDSLKAYSSVDIGFINSDGMEDETEFAVAFMGTRAGENELAKLFSDFCKENGFKTNTVFSVTVVKSADSLKELEADESCSKETSGLDNLER